MYAINARRTTEAAIRRSLASLYNKIEEACTSGLFEVSIGLFELTEEQLYYLMDTGYRISKEDPFLIKISW